MTTTTPGPTKRRNNARGHWYLLDGERTDGVTTIISNGLPKPALVGWAANTIASNVIERLTPSADGDISARELVAYLRTLGAQNRYNRWPNDGSFSRLAALETLKGLHWRDRDQAAGRGTEVHKLAEQLTLGQEVHPPEHLTGHIDAYIDWWNRWQPTDVLTEVVVANRKHRYMGTLDLIAMLAGQRWLIDIKTNRSGPFPEVALQLAAYRHAEVIVTDDDDEQPMPTIDRCAVLWLRADGHDFHEVHVTPHTFRLFLYAQQIAQFQQSDKTEHIGPALMPKEAA